MITKSDGAAPGSTAFGCSGRAAPPAWSGRVTTGSIGVKLVLGASTALPGALTLGACAGGAPAGAIIESENGPIGAESRCEAPRAVSAELGSAIEIAGAVPVIAETASAAAYVRARVTPIDSSISAVWLTRSLAVSASLTRWAATLTVRSASLILPCCMRTVASSTRLFA